MGAKQRAQKRGKASKGSQKGIPASQKKLNSSMHVPDLSSTTRSNALMGWQDFSAASFPSDRKFFSMGDTARNTERHVSGWGQSKLREQAISFVSAGVLHQDPEHVQTQEHKEEVQNEDLEQAHAEESEDEVTDSRLDSVEVETELPVQVKIEPVAPVKVMREPQSKPSVTRPLHPRSASSSSSETEQIVFRGRSHVPASADISLVGSKKTSRTQSSIRPAVPQAETVAPVKIVPELVPAKPIPFARDVNSAPEFEPSSSDRLPKTSRPRRRGRGGRQQRDIDEEEAIMRDYIANMVMDDTEESEEQQQPPQMAQQPLRSKARKNETLRFYDGSGEENAKVQLKPTRRMPPTDFNQAMDWNSDDLEDFDDLGTSDGEVVEVSQVLRYRERSSGPQYLVTPVGLETSDAKWILHEKLASESAKKEIAIFEEIQAMEFEEETLDEDDDEEDDDDETTDEEMEEALNDLIDHIESEDDENARIMKHTARMTDEQIARALAKQEELGMGGDELLLFGDLNDDDDDDDKKVDMDDAFGRNDDFIAFSVQQHTSNRTRSKRNKKTRDSFPSATAFADALDEDPYGGFDVMDFDRPSLRPRKKGRKSDFPYDLELEDDDLREQLVSTWTKDRDKKAQRKRDKEEARQAVALEFADRGEPGAIRAEIRRFLLQEVDTLRLAPMESSTRASVHRLAKALKLNSHSEGKEGTTKGRYPVLTKTPRTPFYTIDTVWEVDSLLNMRKFFPKNAGSYKKEKLPRGTARTMRMRRSGGVQGASYMNGEIVGGSAPEIGTENKGRAMLEKMGWSSGMGIGAEGNKGNLEAIKHVFKTSRAGLG